MSKSRPADAGDRLVQRDFANGRRGLWSYDDAGRLMHILHANNDGDKIFVELAYQRDPVGNPTCREDMVAADMSEHYGYDAGDRLVDFQRGHVDPEDCTLATANADEAFLSHQAWTLDALGNWNTNGCASQPVAKVSAGRIEPRILEEKRGVETPQKTFATGC